MNKIHAQLLFIVCVCVCTIWFELLIFFDDHNHYFYIELNNNRKKAKTNNSFLSCYPIAKSSIVNQSYWPINNDSLYSKIIVVVVVVENGIETKWWKPKKQNSNQSIKLKKNIMIIRVFHIQHEKKDYYQKM